MTEMEKYIESIMQTPIYEAWLRELELDNRLELLKRAKVGYLTSRDVAELVEYETYQRNFYNKLVEV